MTVYRCIRPEWAVTEFPNEPAVVEGKFTNEQISDFNSNHYNIYFLPNFPSVYTSGTSVKGSDIDTFRYVFVDMDLKELKWPNKHAFLEELHQFSLPPTFVVDSGNGMHAYWSVMDLTPQSFLKLQRRLTRKFNTDEAVSKIYQLMRVPNTINTKHKDSPKECFIVESTDRVYTTEELDNALPPITPQDSQYCEQHYAKTYVLPNSNITVEDKIPLKFAQLLKSNSEVKDIWSGNTGDRSKSDYRLAHIMFASGFTRDEAMSTLVNAAKALQRAPTHRIGYAQGIVDKVWIYEESSEEFPSLSESIKDILSRPETQLQGTRFPCWNYLDATHVGFRLGQVIGLVAGSGVGKTAIALNMFLGFVQNNPDCVHFFIPLEQPASEIAERWRTMCGTNTHLHDKVHVISNYAADGSFRHLSLDEIKDYILAFQEKTKKKVGCVVIDHIGALKKKGKTGENQDLMDICHKMKAFAVETNTMLIMQSQAPREKAGIGDLELNKDAAYGTVYFESYCDYLITMWQPLKRCYSEEGCPTVTAFKFCKIRHKKVHLDKIMEDVCYRVFFDPATEHLREMTQDEEKAFDFWNNKSTNKRKTDRKTDVIPYKSITWTKPEVIHAAEVNSYTDTRRIH